VFNGPATTRPLTATATRSSRRQRWRWASVSGAGPPLLRGRVWVSAALASFGLLGLVPVGLLKVGISLPPSPADQWNMGVARGRTSYSPGICVSSRPRHRPWGPYVVQLHGWWTRPTSAEVVQVQPGILSCYGGAVLYLAARRACPQAVRAPHSSGRTSRR